MKKLFVLRHAAAKGPESAPSDFERPLNQRGHTQARDIGQIARAKAGLGELTLNPFPALSSADRNKAMSSDIVRAAELLYTGRFMPAEEGERWGFWNRVVEPEALESEAASLARTLAEGPTFAHAMTKACLHQEWSMSIHDAIDHEAQAQAVCMATNDFERAYQGFVRKETPEFRGD